MFNIFEFYHLWQIVGSCLVYANIVFQNIIKKKLVKKCHAYKAVKEFNCMFFSLSDSVAQTWGQKLGKKWATARHFSDSHCP